MAGQFSQWGRFTELEASSKALEARLRAGTELSAPGVAGRSQNLGLWSVIGWLQGVVSGVASNAHARANALGHSATSTSNLHSLGHSTTTRRVAVCFLARSGKQGSQAWKCIKKALWCF